MVSCAFIAILLAPSMTSIGCGSGVVRSTSLSQ
jgi:hypothetical protein